MGEQWFVYALYSRKSEIIYVGMSMNVERRLDDHNKGKVRSTKGHVTWEVIHKEMVGDRVSARKLEKYYKSAAGKRKLKRMIE